MTLWSRSSRMSRKSSLRGMEFREFRAGWPQGIAPLGLPQIRTCTFAHTAPHIMSSLRDGSLSESALRLAAVLLDPFEFFTSRYHRFRPWFAPLGRGRPTGGQGVVGSGLPIRIYDGNVGVSQVPWKPWWSLSVLFDPGRIRQAEWTKSKLPDTAPACVHDEG